MQELDAISITVRIVITSLKFHQQTRMNRSNSLPVHFLPCDAVCANAGRNDSTPQYMHIVCMQIVDVYSIKH